MKKLSIVLVLTLVFILHAHPGFSASLKFDFNGDEVWDEQATLSSPGDTLTVDVWLADCNETVVSVDYEIYFDSEKLEFNQAASYPYTTPQGGVWTFGSITPPDPYNENIGLLVSTMPFGVVVDGKVKLHRIVFNAIGGESTIGTADGGNYINGMWQTVVILDNAVATIHGPCVITITPDSAEAFPGDTIQFSATEEGSCGTASYNWNVTGGCGSSINASGLYTAGNVSECTDTVTVTDTANGNIQDTASVTIQTPLTIEPENPTIGAGGKICFQGVTDMCSDPVYTWSVESSGGYTVSTINALGCYRARRDVSPPPDCEETFDTVYLEADCSGDKKTAETTVTVTPCVVTISPGSQEIETGDTIQFTASGNGCCVNAPCYTWEVSAAGTTGNTTNTTKTKVLAKNNTSEPAGPIYTWSLADAGATGNTGNTFVFQAGSTVGTVMVEVTDTCNNNSADTVTVKVTASSSSSTTTSIIVDPNACTNDAYCFDGRFCNGIEKCVNGRCRPGNNPCPDDGVFCNGEEGCDEDEDACVSSGNPCPPDDEPERDICSEDRDTCIECLSDEDCEGGAVCNEEGICFEPVTPLCTDDADCDDENVCTDDTCNPEDPGANEEGCVYTNNTNSCDDEFFCTETDVCVEGECVGSGDPCEEGETCDEENDICVPGDISFELFPKSALRSHLVPLPLVMLIVSTDSATQFNRGTTDVSFDDALTPPLTIVLSKNAILTISIITPGKGVTGSTEVGVTVTTDAGEGTEMLTLNMLPLFLGE